MHVEPTELLHLFLWMCRFPLAHSFILAHIPAARHLHWSLVLAGLQRHHGASSRLPLSQRQGRALTLPHGQLLCSKVAFDG